MPFIELQNIGKIYVSNNNVAVGIRGVNLSFELGEFVAITGKSGAGKSTLLNVISGIDSYDEGELLIEGSQTSHYLQPEWEEYRKKYISFVFQDYNIIESYTVLQNVELALMHIENPRERRKQAIEFINRVGLGHRLKSKGSKLSGGEKQRTVIARALAKNSPVIICDEPTGNLDSQTSHEIIELISEISKDKLVIVVTHNFDDFKDYATRHIRIYDGRVESDEVIKAYNKVEEKYTNNIQKQEKLDNLKKGAILGKTVLFSKPRLAVFMMLLMLIGTIGLFYSGATFGQGFKIFEERTMFTKMDNRLIITKINGEAITDNELDNIKTKYQVNDYLHYDYLLDQSTAGSMYVEEINQSFEFAYVYNKTYGNNIIGRYPEKENEVFLYLPIYYKPDFGSKELKITKISFSNNANKELYDIVGVKYYYDNNLTPEILFTKEGFELATSIYYLLSTSNYDIQSVTYNKINNSKSIFTRISNIYLSFDIEANKVLLSDRNYSDFVKENGINNISSVINFQSIYRQVGRMDWYIDDGEVNSYKFTKTFKDEDIIVYNDNLYPDNTLVMSVSSIKQISDNTLSTYYSQASLFFKTQKQMNNAINGLKDDGYICVSSDAFYKGLDVDTLLTSLSYVFMLLVFILIVVFISFFINLVTSKSLEAFRSDLAIMRSMGINEKVIKVSMYFRIIYSIIPAFFVVTITLLVFYLTPRLNTVFRYLYWYQYLIIIIGVIILGITVCKRQDKKLFSQSVKKAIKDGE